MRDTTTQVADALLNMVSLNDSLPLTILEPSAGIGFLAEAVQTKFFNSTIDCIELNKDKFDVLSGKFVNSIHGDFLKVELETKYDLIVAAPPFKGNIDLAHIMKMYDLLNPNGELVSLTTPYWLTNNEPLQVEFREWLTGKKHEMKMLPDMSFSEKGKTVPTAIIKIIKEDGNSN